MTDRAAVVARVTSRHRLRWWELAPWVAALAFFFAFDGYLVLGTQILIMTLFALSLDLIVGFAGIVTLGHAAFFGVGAYTVGLLARWGGVAEPVTTLVIAVAVASAAGALTGLIILRTQKLTLLMLTMTITLVLLEIANKAGAVTGGADGLQGIEIRPVLGQFRFDLYGKTSFLYCLAVLALGWWLVRALVHAWFGRALVGVRENPVRMHAIGTPVFRRLLAAYSISAGLAGAAGALLTQTTSFVALKALSFELSGEALIMLILGGVGRLYGAFIGTPVYMLFQDTAAKTDPYYWYLYLGLLLVAVVLFARGGLIGLGERLATWLRGRRR